MSGDHAHQRVPADPEDGEVFTCTCGVSFRYVVRDGFPEWVSAAD